jgi:hypothetical protein
MKILSFDSYDRVRPFWSELSRTYKNGELALDWTANKLIWDHFYKNRGFHLNIVIGVQDGCCTGIFPLLYGDFDMNDVPYWSFNDDFIISKEYFCPPEGLHHFLRHLPPHFCDDLSCFYMPEKPRYFYRAARGLIDMKLSNEDYFQSLKKKYRHDLRRTWNMNVDVEVSVTDRLHTDKIDSLLQYYLDHWRQKNTGLSKEYIQYSRDKILTDLLLMHRAEELGKLIAQYFYLGGELVAANFSIRREQDRVDDYLCLRNSQERFSSRGLGIFAILKNMEHCRKMGIKYYDLSSCMNGYKRKFVNMETFFYVMAFDVLTVQENTTRAAQ